MVFTGKSSPFMALYNSGWWNMIIYPELYILALTIHIIITISIVYLYLYWLIYIYMGMDQYLLIPFLGGWTSINPSYFDVNYRGTRFWHTTIYIYTYIHTHMLESVTITAWRRLWLHGQGADGRLEVGLRSCEKPTVIGWQPGWWKHGYGSIPIDTIFSGMNILPAILMFTRYQGFDPSPHFWDILKGFS